MGRYSGKKCRLITMFWLTTFFFLVEIIVGYITNSMALVADSFHMLSDIAALVVAYLSVKVSGARDNRHRGRPRGNDNRRVLCMYRNENYSRRRLPGHVFRF